MKRILLCFFFLLCCSFAFPQEEYISIVEKASKETGVPLSILMGVILTESDGVFSCVSPYRADGHRDEGIMQLNSKYLSYFSWKFNKGVKVDPLSPSSAIPVGARILAHNYKFFGSWVEALAAYRQGITGVLKHSVTHASFLYIDSVFTRGAPYE